MSAPSWVPKAVLKGVKQLDAYPKVNEDFFTRTFSGGIITIISSICMIVLFISEAVDFKRVQVSQSVSELRRRRDRPSRHKNFNPRRKNVDVFQLLTPRLWCCF